MNSNYDYKGNGWNIASVIDKPTVGVLSSSAIMPKARHIETYTAQTITEPSPGVFVFDFGQNVAGVTRIKIPGNDKRGMNITLIHSEELDPNGNIVEMYAPRSPMIGTYTLRGDGNDEIYEASFTYYGYQYVSVTGYPSTPDLNCIESIFIHSDFDTSVGSIQFGTSNVNIDNNAYLLNKIQHMTRYASLSNYINIPTDCPQRERRGWLGDAQLSALTTIHNFDMAAAYTKYIRDIQDSQDKINSKGALGDCVPYYKHGAMPGIRINNIIIVFPNIYQNIWSYYR